MPKREKPVSSPASDQPMTQHVGSLHDYSADIVETVREPLVLLDWGLRVVIANAAFYRNFGGSPVVTRRRSLFDLAEGRWDAPELHTVLHTLQTQDVSFENHEVFVNINGTPKVYRLNARRLRSADSDSATLLLAFEDVTELLRVEERMRDLARMEAVGQLAGGVAHEINNQMTVLVGYMAFVAKELGPDDPRRKDLQLAERAADHVVYITRQLLNFSRKQMIKRETLDPWTVLGNMQTVLSRVLGPAILLNLVRKGPTRAIEFDEGQLSELLLNLALNARYAMGRTGTFEVAISAVEVDTTSTQRFPGQDPGRYVRFEVSDTGTGMDAETLKRVFEPFFTTKPVGEGTGLGLASAFGAVTQNGGFIRVESQLGKGTTFVLELPEVAFAQEPGQASAPPSDLPRGEETVIVAEDEEGVRGWISRVLRDCGYTVLEARNGAEALRLFAAHAAEVRLVLTDLVMPGLDGREVGKRLAAHAPGVPVLYMTAYTRDEVARRELVAHPAKLLQKPFSAASLAQSVRLALDESLASSQG